MAGHILVTMVALMVTLRPDRTPDIQVRIIVEIETAVGSAISRKIGPVTATPWIGIATAASGVGSCGVYQVL